MGTNDRLVLLGIIKTLDVVEVRDIKGSNVVTKSDGEVGKLAVGGNLRVNGGRLLGFGAEIVKELGNTLSSIGILAEGVDDPNLAWTDSACGILVLLLLSENSLEHLRCKSSGFGMTGDKFYVLDAIAIGNSDGGNNAAVVKIPETESRGADDSGSGLQNGQRDNVVGCEDYTGIEVNGETMRRELFSKDVKLILMLANLCQEIEE